ncbi:hypothetical protein JAAARDRAFT_132359 [Jaapia argillacea MUCL 33604]|uniref:ubiquitinyl hydrolase 1 n=1 Tax=Jaapia argillacea MUCL 33604 TaxID=933084 RepID=A0A067Q189_9AGAM|nr:hypothetical protein JAAARDRAFT_132359 [Jaapia argillacea MUCL 33604]
MDRPNSLDYIVHHVFLPPKLPQGDDQHQANDLALCERTMECAKAYSKSLSPEAQLRWAPIVRMLENLKTSQRFSALATQDILASVQRMGPGDIVVLLIRAQNAGLIIRKFVNKTVFESFEVSPPNASVMETEGKLLCSYPGPAIAVPNDIVEDRAFQEELSSFLSHMDVDVLDSTPTTIKARSAVVETRDTPHPRYITQLLTGILRGMGAPEDVNRIRKRIADEVLWNDVKLPWRRSPLWLVIRVALQTSLCENGNDHTEYKAFMIFMMARILRAALDQGYASDVLFCMRAKVARRLLKLGSSTPGFVLSEAKTIGEAVGALLQQRWSAVQREQMASADWRPHQLDIIADTQLSLSNSRAYLTKVMRPGPIKPKLFKFTPPQVIPRIRGIESLTPSTLSAAFSGNSFVPLADFEEGIQGGIDEWVENHLVDESACPTVAAWITEYYKAAQELYTPNSEDWSIMLLTLFDLWMALDKLAVAQCPLLRDYSPDVPIRLLEALLLRTAESITRASAIIGYLRWRHRFGRLGSVFSGSTAPDSFPVRFFEASLELKHLKSRIETSAKEDKKRKLEELQEKNARYHSNMAKADELSHQYSITERGDTRHAKKQCSKCNYERLARQSITPHEWPLPKNELHAKTAVFELACPVPFAVWREMTYKILHDVCTPRRLWMIHCSAKVELRHYEGLRKFASGDRIRRITLGSLTKSFLNSHYKKPAIPARETEVCVNNALQLAPFDISLQAFLEHPFSNCDTGESCKLHLPQASPYLNLQYALDGTDHTSNHILANQTDCHRDLSLHEYIAFAGLRSGHRLQWMNILREITARSLSFHREEVLTLTAMAIWQIGPLSPDDAWDWHVDLTSSQFGLALLRQLRGLLSSIQANWLETVTMRIIIILISRILVATSDPDVIAASYPILQLARETSLRWMRQLVTKLQGCEADDVIKEFQLRVCEVAAACRSTYDIGPVHMPIVMESIHDVAIAIECGIVVFENTPSGGKSVPIHMEKLLARDRRLSHSLEPLLRERIHADRTTLDKAVNAVWPAYRPGSTWLHLPSPNSQWISSSTASVDGESQHVHLNLLNGQLLVDGKPLGRLPETIVNHPTYARIFGGKIFDIIPSDLAGFDFATRSLVYGYTVYFRLEDGEDLLIRTRRGAQQLQLIPHAVMRGDFPHLLVEHRAHWLDLLSGEMEFRPLDSLWSSSPDNWWTNFSTYGASVMHRKAPHETLQLIDVRSPTFKMVSSIFRPIESPEYLIATCCGTQSSFSIDLHRYRLSFFLNDRQELECTNLSGRVIDKDQSIGSFVGLRSRLVLRDNLPVGTKTLPSRCLIIPIGEVRVKRHSHHVHVTVDTGSQNHVRFHQYAVDPHLGRLVGNVSLGGKLYKVLLHAVSSHCLPDPLTGYTGTEEALREMSSASCRSFQKLDESASELLRRIGSLTPIREYYPSHLKAMQKTNWWDELSPLAQHHGFHALSDSARHHAESLRILQVNKSDAADSPSNRSTTSASTVLLRRASLRNANYYPRGPTDNLELGAGDVEYISRDFLNTSTTEEESLAANFSSMILRQPLYLATSFHILDTFKTWGDISGPRNDSQVTLSYCRDWMEQDLSQTWLTLYCLCRTAQSEFQLAFTLCAMAYGPNRAQVRTFVPTLLSFATVPQFRAIHPPPWPSYDFARGTSPRKRELLDIAGSCAVTFKENLVCEIKKLDHETKAEYNRRRYSHYESSCKSEAEKATDLLMAQWPCEEPSCPSTRFKFLDIHRLLGIIRPLFLAWYRNADLHRYLQKVEKVLDDARDSTAYSARAYIFHRRLPSAPPSTCSPKSGTVTIQWLFECDAPDPPPLPETLGVPPAQRGYHTAVPTSDLRSLIDDFQSNSTSSLHRLYGEKLERSLQALEILPMPYSLEDLLFHRKVCVDHFEHLFSLIRRSLSPSNSLHDAALTAGVWPRITTLSLLRQLALTSCLRLTSQWRRTLSAFAAATILNQRSQRLISCYLLGNREELMKELENMGSLDEYSVVPPDWLLIQIDGDFLARPLQLRVAEEMISPSLRQNMVLQLNMGEGKTSVIVPLVASTLADGLCLARVVVLKPLANQMFQLLVQRLSGLTNRQIFYLPFSRSVAVASKQASLHVRGLYETCMQVRGVLVVQPEHILSFKLMGIDRLLSAKSSEERNIAKHLLDSQLWLESHSRDVLDESDEILRSNFQLIYTRGEPRPLEHHPDRWTTIQQVFALVRKHAPRIQQKYPSGADVTTTQCGSHPSIRILEVDAGEALIAAVVEDVMAGGLMNCCFEAFPNDARQVVARFIQCENIADDEAGTMEEFCGDTGLWKSLLLLRGLFGHGILLYVLRERRWRVDYGLHLARSLLAVPYRAKDVPSPRAEFGHPDVAILLTCMSYYYGGLSEDDLDVCFDRLFKLDNPKLEYDRWVRADSSMPEGLHQLSGVNLKDIELRKEILVPHFQRNHAIIDFYLSQVVFPKEAKEFPEKLTTSSWDMACSKSHFTTGFSGTNENQYLLPTSIAQCDPLDQLSTNAKVMTYLLRPENNSYICPSVGAGGCISGKALLELVVRQTPEIRVLLDVGAQILEMTNCQVAKHWLSMLLEVQAAVFFDDDDDLVVITRDGTIESFVSSSYNQQLDKCVVYLDDAHTRGTDLKLPRDSRAAVTLGPKVTKDRLIQGCMRLRKLGFGQTVMFFAPLEVDRKIREAARKPSEQVSSRDVLRWTMLETCTDIQRQAPHWAQQGVDFFRRNSAWKELSTSNDASLTALGRAWVLPEARELESMYGIPNIRIQGSSETALHNFSLDIPEIHDRCMLLGTSSLSHQRTDEEQEREVAHEMEREQQVQRPPKATAAPHKIHRDVDKFVVSGVLPRGSPAFRSPFLPLSGARRAHEDPWSPRLLATDDFLTSVKTSSIYLNDYLRPVQWIISSSHGGSLVLVIVSPYEANDLLPKIRQYRKVHLHQYTPRVTQAMEPVDDLKLHCIPPTPPSWVAPEPILVAQLNLCAGQLYVADYQAYLLLCEFLGIYTPDLQSVDGIQWQGDGFINPEHRRRLTNRTNSPFTHSPLPYLKELIGLRRKGMTYTPTHLGKILHSRFLSPDDF